MCKFDKLMFTILLQFKKRLYFLSGIVYYVRAERIIRTRLKEAYFGAFYPIHSCNPDGLTSILTKFERKSAFSKRSSDYPLYPFEFMIYGVVCLCLKK